MDIYCFTSEDVKNIWAGVGAQKWAVTPNDNIHQSNVTKGLKMRIGSFGLFYSVEEKILTTPFVVKSKPTETEEKDIWKQGFVLPFAIKTIGDPYKRISINEIQDILITHGEDRSWNKLFRIGGKFNFVKSNISDEIWEELLEKLM